MPVLTSLADVLTRKLPKVVSSDAHLAERSDAGAVGVGAAPVGPGGGEREREIRPDADAVAFLLGQPVGGARIQPGPL